MTVLHRRVPDWLFLSIELTQ